MKSPMKSVAIRLASVFAMALALVLVSCGDDAAAGPVAVSGVSLAPPNMSIAAGATAPLVANISPGNATDKTVTWDSTNKAVATVTGSGLSVTVNAATAGNSTIIVTTKDGDKTAFCEVTVTPRIGVTGVTLPPALALVAGTTGSLTATIAPPNATNKDVTWDSSNKAVATVTGTGLTVTVNALAAGTSNVTVKTADGGHTATCAVTVTSPVVLESVSIVPTTMSLTVGGAAGSLAATVVPAGAAQVSWTSGNTAVATVTGNNLSATVAPVSAGETIITALAGDKAAFCTVTVTNPSGAAVTGLLLPKAATVKVGGQKKLTADLWPFDASNRGVAWTSNNESVATVSGGGLIGTVAGAVAGTARITATSQGNPSVSAYCDVTVVPAIWQEVVLACDWAMLKNGDWDESNYRLYWDYFQDVFVDPDGVEHAAGFEYDYIPLATYYRNGEITYLPPSSDAEYSNALSMHVTDDGHVYIAGVEEGSAGYRARLWVDGASVPLGGQDGLMTQATGVFAQGGNVYVAGAQAPLSGGETRAVLWVKRVGSQEYVKTVLNNQASRAVSVAALGGDVYVSGSFGSSSLVKLSPDDPAANAPVPGYETSGNGGIIKVRVIGEDIYAAGWMGNNPAWWKNGVSSPLPWEYNGADYADATDIAVANDGSVYVSGIETYWGSEPHGVMWKNGFKEVGGGYGWIEIGMGANAVFVKETPMISVTGVTLDKTTLDIPVGYTGTLTATLEPENPNDPTVFWTTSNAGVASITGAGRTVTINGLTVGTATITVRTQDGNFTKTCAVNVQNVAVTGVTLSPKTLTLGQGRTGQLLASIVPPTATNKAVTWESSNPSVATVTGSGLTGTLLGVGSSGTTTITVRTAQGDYTDTCTVTAAPTPSKPAIYVTAGYGGLYVDGVHSKAVGSGNLAWVSGEPEIDIYGVYVDGPGNVHAVGQWYLWSADTPSHAVYYKNGSPAVYLPETANDDGGYAFDVFVAADGKVYVAGQEATNSYGFGTVARLWIDGVQETLPGIDPAGTYFSVAQNVCVRGGDVYVAGGAVPIGDPQRNCNPVIWKGGTKYEFSRVDSSIEYFHDPCFDSGGNLYVLRSGTNGYKTVYTVNSALTTATPYVLEDTSDFIQKLFVDGTDVYVAGYYGPYNNYDACYWINKARVTLPRPAGAAWVKATAVYVVDGHVYVAGVSGGHSDGYHIPVWLDGALLADERAITDTLNSEYYAKPRSMFVK